LPSGNDPRVELLGANDGRVVADGLRLISAGAQAANIAYIHSDHLGSPQKMTDNSQALTWDAQFDPFGEEFLISGSAVQPNRFPGQYADAETGYSYNYFRDYDPTVGRYIQSDPIGLRGGMNTYGYVDGNPVVGIDPYGLTKPKAGLFRTRPCTNEERRSCENTCRARGREFESCRVSQTFRVVAIKGGLAVHEWKDGPMSCSCKESFCQRNGAACTIAGVALGITAVALICTPIPGDEVAAGATAAALLGISLE
jgi:RHS repeat-associated protein